MMHGSLDIVMRRRLCQEPQKWVWSLDYWYRASLLNQSLFSWFWIIGFRILWLVGHVRAKWWYRYVHWRVRSRMLRCKLLKFMLQWLTASLEIVGIQKEDMSNTGMHALPSKNIHTRALLIVLEIVLIVRNISRLRFFMNLKSVEKCIKSTLKLKSRREKYTILMPSLTRTIGSQIGRKW